MVPLLGVFEGSVTKNTSFFQRGNLARPDATAVGNHQSLIILESEPYHAKACLGKYIIILYASPTTADCGSTTPVGRRYRSKRGSNPERKKEKLLGAKFRLTRDVLNIQYGK